MSDSNTAPDPLSQVQDQAADALDQEDAADAIARVRGIVGLRDGTDDIVRSHYNAVLQREIATTGESKTHRAWNERQKNPEAWTERERKLAAELIVDQRRRMPVPKCPEGHPAHRNLTAAERGRMNDRDWNQLKADQKYWSELSPAQRRQVEREYEGRRK